MRNHVPGLLHILFHSGLPILLVLILLVGNAVLSDASGLMR
jgi:hypothetical protein